MPWEGGIQKGKVERSQPYSQYLQMLEDTKRGSDELRKAQNGSDGFVLRTSEALCERLRAVLMFKAIKAILRGLEKFCNAQRIVKDV